MTGFYMKCNTGLKWVKVEDLGLLLRISRMPNPTINSAGHTDQPHYCVSDDLRNKNNSNLSD